MWICCQLGAREHYSIPYSLFRSGDLALLITDAWADGRLPWKLQPGTRAAERHHPGIPSVKVQSFDWRILAFEAFRRRRFSGWKLTMARNEWFQRRTIETLREFRRRHPGEAFTLFSYSYTARLPFTFAKESGWPTVLGQIDPGPFEEDLVMDLYRKNGHPELAQPAPRAYWAQWREECAAADRILVNSEWSRQGLESAGIDSGKLRVVPLVYDPPLEAARFVRTFPATFYAERPLRVLFLGQINLRKGAAEVLAAFRELKGLPVELWMVGPGYLPGSLAQQDHPQVKWFGAVPRGAAMNYYRDADVFLFPTFSDGFGLTQLEAQSWSLPVIASRHCGDVVRHMENGYVLSHIGPGAIAAAIREIVANPAILARMAEKSSSCPPRFATRHLSGWLTGAAGTSPAGAKPAPVGEIGNV